MKNYLALAIITIFFISISLLFFSNKDELKEQKTKINETFSNIQVPYYREDLKNEYTDYQQKTSLPYETVITHVNIGLSKPFYTNAKKIINPNSLTTLVNKYHYLDENYVPNNLIETDKYAKNNIKIQKECFNAFIKMSEDIEKENMHIRIVSAYRSFDYQKNLYNNYLKKDTQEMVDTYSARPGHSEHQLGLAIDIDNIYTDYNRFHITLEFTWMQENAYKYGFILRYPLGKENITGYKYEPWHYRYVGKEIAKDMKEKNLTYDEYYVRFLEK